MFKDKFILLGDTVKDLGISCEQLGIQYTSKLSTLEVTVSQQSIQIKSLEKQLKEMDTFAQEGWDLIDVQNMVKQAETYTIQIQKLQTRIGELEISLYGIRIEDDDTDLGIDHKILKAITLQKDMDIISGGETTELLSTFTDKLLGDEEMTNDERTESQTIANKNSLEETILDLAEWELISMDETSLQEFFVNNMVDYYRDTPKALNDMLEYQKECTDTDTVFYWDVDKKEILPVTTRNPTWVDEKFREIARQQDNDMVDSP